MNHDRPLNGKMLDIETSVSGCSASVSSKQKIEVSKREDTEEWGELVGLAYPSPACPICGSLWKVVPLTETQPKIHQFGDRNIELKLDHWQSWKVMPDSDLPARIRDATSSARLTSRVHTEPVKE